MEGVTYSYIAGARKNSKLVYTVEEKQIYSYKVMWKNKTNNYKRFQCYQKGCKAFVDIDQATNACIMGKKLHDHDQNQEALVKKFQFMTNIKNQVAQPTLETSRLRTIFNSAVEKDRETGGQLEYAKVKRNLFRIKAKAMPPVPQTPEHFITIFKNGSIKRRRIYWKPEDEVEIISLWEEFQNDLSTEKRNSHVYAEISKRLNGRYSKEEVHVKIRNLKQKYRTTEKEFGTSAPSKWVHYKKVQKILEGNSANDDDLIDPFMDNSDTISSISTPLSISPSPISDAESEDLEESIPEKRKYYKEIVKNIKKQTQLHETELSVVKKLCADFSSFLQRQEQRDKAFLTVFQKLEGSL